MVLSIKSSALLRKEMEYNIIAAKIPCVVEKIP